MASARRLASSSTGKKSRYDADRIQAFIRIYALIAVGLYVGAMAVFDRFDPAHDLRLGAFVIAYVPFALAILAWVHARPGPNVPRRIITMAGDFSGCTWLLSHGGAASLPIFTILLWMVVGMGVRFGRAYVPAAAVLGLSSIAVATYFNSYWQQNPYVVATFMLTAVIVPIYVLWMLTRIENAYREAKAANQSKSQMMAQASHDLRQPIHAISLFTACLRDSGLQARELEMVENIDRSLASVSRLFKSLLDISALDSGRVEPKSEVFAVGDVLDDVARQNEAAAQHAGSELSVIPCSLFVVSDRALLTTVVQNLVNNAVKYAAGRRILLGCRRRGRMVDLVVIDTGPGIPAEHQVRVFEEFYQVRSRGDRDLEGVGLGLAIVRRVAELLELHVELQSTPGRGTRVEVRGLRVIEKPAAESRTAIESFGSLEGLRVLLIEDDAAVLEATASLLRRWGCKVQAVSGVPEHVAHADLLITDYDLGGCMTGTECISLARALLGENLQAIVMTGHDTARVRDELRDAGVPVLAKPVRPSELRSVIMSARVNAARESPRTQPL